MFAKTTFANCRPPTPRSWHVCLRPEISFRLHRRQGSTVSTVSNLGGLPNSLPFWRGAFSDRYRGACSCGNETPVLVIESADSAKRKSRPRSFGRVAAYPQAIEMASCRDFTENSENEVCAQTICLTIGVHPNKLGPTWVQMLPH